MSNNQLPQDPIMEQALLGCLMIYPDAYFEIADIDIRPEDFFNRNNRVIFEAMQSIIARNEKIDISTVISELESKKVLNSLGSGQDKGYFFIAKIAEEQVASVNAPQYARRVKDTARLRQMIEVSLRIYRSGFSKEDNPSELIAEAQSEMAKLSLGVESSHSATMADLVAKSMQTTGPVPFTRTGYVDLDRKITGLRPGQLVVVAGRPSMGKTAFAIELTKKIAKQSKETLIFSLEMTQMELYHRMLSSESEVPLGNILNQTYQAGEKEKCLQASHRLSTAPITVNDKGRADINYITACARSVAAQGKKLGAIMIDYVGIMGDGVGAGKKWIQSRTQVIGEITKNLKALAKELECPIILVSQLNRGVEGRDDKRPFLSDLRESGDIEQDADIIMLLYRDDYYNREQLEESPEQS